MSTASSGQSGQHDIVVVGGGMVGAAAALGLAQEGWRVAIVEASSPSPFIADSEPDLRVSAISRHSVDLLQQLGAWPAITSMRVASYRHLQTWEREQWQVSFSAVSLGLPELGFMVENSLIQLGLWQQLQRMPSVTLYTPDALSTLNRMEQGWQMTLQSGMALETRLVIGADGADSRVRHLAGIGISGWDYRQSCMLITVQTEQEQQDTTWQAFYPSGPRALLPLHGHYATLAWYDQPQRIRQLLSLSADELSYEIIHVFPARLGSVQALKSGSFALVRRHAQRYIDEGLVLLGDAAHTINPLAGQGVNLGYRDVAALLETLRTAKQSGRCWYSRSTLQRYQRCRLPDNLLMQTGMDLFYAVFSNSHTPLFLLRNLALLAAENSGELKKKVLWYALGI